MENRFFDPEVLKQFDQLTIQDQRKRLEASAADLKIPGACGRIELLHVGSQHELLPTEAVIQADHAFVPLKANLESRRLDCAPCAVDSPHSPEHIHRYSANAVAEVVPVAGDEL